MVAYDFVILLWSSQGFRYVLVAVNLFTKHLEAWALKNKEDTSVIEGLEICWFSPHGIPNILLSDQGPRVDGNRVREMCARLDIQKRHYSAYHPQGDGQVERTIQSFKTALRCLLQDREITKKHWPSLLQEVTFILNFLPNASTSLSPREVMYGTPLRIQLDKWLPFHDSGDYVEVQEYAERTAKQNGQL